MLHEKYKDMEDMKEKRNASGKKIPNTEDKASLD